MIWLILTLWVVCGYRMFGVVFNGIHEQHGSRLHTVGAVVVAGGVSIFVPAFLVALAIESLWECERRYPWQVKHDRH